MRVGYTERAAKTLQDLPADVRKALYKQLHFLEENLRHPSLRAKKRAKKYDETRGLWQARVNKDWRFYFMIRDDVYYVVDVIPHPKRSGVSARGTEESAQRQETKTEAQNDYSGRLNQTTSCSSACT